MAVMAELHAAIFIEPGPEDVRFLDDEYQEEERTTLFWEERNARSIELEEQRLLNQRCSRVAEALRIKKEETKTLSPNQRRLGRRLERLLQDFSKDEVLQELRRMGIF